MYVHNLPRCSRLRSVDGSLENLENEISLLQLSIYWDWSSTAPHSSRFIDEFG